ncbi:RNA polymerase sigma factor [Phyllobacterium endophyticum]|uniref:RNA polymerase sigma factor n=1 Tax=Phyllobacterium endophyticum TaxID=1149773 RepID=UPI0011C9E285|nr:RNA polymerase sigma factor [Phyllobacterium endophyticum]TXR48412.1 RNA polymerase sigma factor [Phyllobacterium endophyticum]
MTDKAQIKADLSRCLGRLWRFGAVLSLSSGLAEALVQATCIRGLEGSPHFDNCNVDYDFFAILYSIWQKPAFILGKDVAIPAMDDGILRQLTALSDAYRATAYLAYVEHLSYAEIAKVLAIPVSTVRSRLTCVRVMLAEKDRNQRASCQGEGSTGALLPSRTSAGKAVVSQAHPGQR